jgi:hypothetical protein
MQVDKNCTDSFVVLFPFPSNRCFAMHFHFLLIVVLPCAVAAGEDFFYRASVAKRRLGE